VESPITITLLLTSEMKPVPKSIKILSNWDTISMIVPSDNTIVVGDHVCLKGTEEDFKNWLRPFNGIWVGQGSPMLQEFTLSHIK
jgi:hypothetical protein